MDYVTCLPGEGGPLAAVAAQLLQLLLLLLLLYSSGEVLVEAQLLPGRWQCDRGGDVRPAAATAIAVVTARERVVQMRRRVVVVDSGRRCSFSA